MVLCGSAFNEMLKRRERKVMFFGFETIVRILNRDWDTYDYYWKNECFFSIPVKESAVVADKEAKHRFRIMYK